MRRAEFVDGRPISSLKGNTCTGCTGELSALCSSRLCRMELAVDVSVSTAFDARVTDQTLTGSRGDRSATRRQLYELAVSRSASIDDDSKAGRDDDVKWSRRNYGVVPSSPNRSRHARPIDELPA